MTEKDSLAESIANTISDYRQGQIAQPDGGHVIRWVDQFPQEARVPVLRELDHVLKRTYLSRRFTVAFVEDIVTARALTDDRGSEQGCGATFLRTQKRGHSQADLLALLDERVEARLGHGLESSGSIGSPFVYIDDALFSGETAACDLEKWIEGNAPKQADLAMVFMVLHTYGEYAVRKRLAEAASRAGKHIVVRTYCCRAYENRWTYRNTSDVLWPTRLPESPDVKAYLRNEVKAPFHTRHPQVDLDHPVFTCEEGRQVLEAELLMAGLRIRTFSQHPEPTLRPLGYSPFGFGFGSLVASYRNCPNNAPLALWWGDPKAPSYHPLSKWYPLLPRVTNDQPGYPEEPWDYA